MWILFEWHWLPLLSIAIQLICWKQIDWGYLPIMRNSYTAVWAVSLWAESFVIARHCVEPLWLVLLCSSTGWETVLWHRRWLEHFHQGVVDVPGSVEDLPLRTVRAGRLSSTQLNTFLCHLKNVSTDGSSLGQQMEVYSNKTKVPTQSAISYCSTALNHDHKLNEYLSNIVLEQLITLLLLHIVKIMNTILYSLALNAMMCQVYHFQYRAGHPWAKETALNFGGNLSVYVGDKMNGDDLILR